MPETRVPWASHGTYRPVVGWRVWGAGYGCWGVGWRVWGCGILLCSKDFGIWDQGLGCGVRYLGLKEEQSGALGIGTSRGRRG